MIFNKKKKEAEAKSLELTKTLVLNFNEVEQVAKYEKKTSKKPAGVVALIGLFAIMLGVFYPSINASFNKSQPKDKVVDNKFRETETVSVISSSLECSLAQTNADNTTTVLTLDFTFDNGKLKSYDKKTNVVSTISNLTQTPNTIIVFDTAINAIMQNTIEGYVITKEYQPDATNSNVVSNYNAKVSIDLEKVNKAAFPTIYSTNPYLNIEYNLDDNIDMIKQKLTMAGYTCN